MNRNTYIRSGEWVIISRGKNTFSFKKKIFNNLRFRIFIIVLLAGLVPSVAALFGIVKVYESRAVSLRTAEIQNQCTILTNQISASHYFEDTSQEVVNDSLNQLTNIYNGRVMVIDDQLRVVKDTYSLDEGKLDVSESVVRCMKGTSTNNYDKKNHYIEVTAPIAIPGEDQIRGVMLASVSTDSIEDSLDVLYTQGSVIIGLVMIFLTIVAVFAADCVVRPLHQIAATIENVSAGYSDDVLHVDTFTETKSISEAINKMMGRLKLLDDSREEFVSNVSHELKTPMTSMKVLADSLLEQENLPVEMYQEFMGDIAKEIDRENKIITDLLSLVKMDKKGQTLNIESININELLEQILKRLKPIAEKLGIEKLLEKYPYEVSGGQKQRAAIARALITKPQLILADEPSGALDSKAADSLMNLFTTINQDGQTIVMVTHSVKAASSAKRVLFIKDGKVFHQLYRGNLTNEEMYERISDTLKILTTGGEEDE